MALEGINARLDRAKEHIVNLERECSDFRNLYKNAIGHQINRDLGEIVTHLNPLDAIPLRMSVEIGEVLFLLRSSLDHVIAQMLIKVTPAADIDKILERSEFPIFTDPERYKSFDRTKIKGLSDLALDFIDKCQPCNGTNHLPAKDHPLAVLASLNNFDKHRLLIVLAHMFQIHEVAMTGPMISQEVYTNEVFVSSTDDQTPLFKTLVPTTGTDKTNLEIKASIEIAFKDVGTRKGEPVMPTLNNLLDAVRDVVRCVELNGFV